MGLERCVQPGSLLCPSQGLAGSSLLGSCRAPGCSIEGFLQLGSSPIAAWTIQPPCVAANGDTGVSPLSPSQPLVPQKSIVGFALSQTGVRVGFYPCSLPGGACCQHCCVPVPFGTGTGGSLWGWGPPHRAVYVMGTGAGGGVASRGADPGALLSGAKHCLGELCRLLRDPLEMSGVLLHLPTFCWPHTVHGFPSPPPPWPSCVSVMQRKGHDVVAQCSQGSPSRQVPPSRGMRSWGQWRDAAPGGFLGRAPAWGQRCLCSGDRDRTAHTQQCCMQTELREGGNKRLDFSSSCLAGAPQRRRCMAVGSWRAFRAPLSRGGTHCQQ